MFKPSLKRSKLTHPHSLSLSTSASASPYTTTYISPQQQLLKDKTYLRDKLTTPDIYIPQLFTKSSINAPFNIQNINNISNISNINNSSLYYNNIQNRTITPLNSWNLQYPYQVREKLNQPIQKIKSRIIGTKYGIYWLSTQNQLHLWKYNSLQNPSQLSLHRKFQFQKNIRAIAVGHLDKNQCGLVNVQQNLQTIAIGFEHIIDLYTINISSLQLQTMEIRLKIEYSQILQKLEMNNNNQILYTGNYGYLTRVAFDCYDYYGMPNIVKSSAKPIKIGINTILNKLQVTKTNIRVYTEKILCATSKITVPISVADRSASRAVARTASSSINNNIKNTTTANNNVMVRSAIQTSTQITYNKIYVLVRKQSEGSILQKLGLSILKFFSGRIKYNQESINIQKQIHVYHITDRKYGSIKYMGMLKNAQIEQKIKQSFSANDKISRFFTKTSQRQQQMHPNRQTNTIVNIYLNRINKYGQQQAQTAGKSIVDVDYIEKLSIVTSYGLYLTLGENIGQSANGNGDSYGDGINNIINSNYIRYRGTQSNKYMRDYTNTYNFSFDQQPLTLPTQLYQTNNRNTALFMHNNRGYIRERNNNNRDNTINNTNTSNIINNSNNRNTIQQVRQEQQQCNILEMDNKNNKIIYSLGFNNINFMSNGLCVYFDGGTVQIAKFSTHPGYILQSQLYPNTHNYTYNNNYNSYMLSHWHIFSKSQITIMRKSSTAQNIVASMYGWSELQKIGVENGQSKQQYQAHLNSMVQDISKVIGTPAICVGLSQLLLTIYSNRIQAGGLVNNKKQPILYISNQMKELVKQECRNKIRVYNRYRKAYGYQYKNILEDRPLDNNNKYNNNNNNNNSNSNGLFMRWMIPKRKQIRLQAIAITAEMEYHIWKLFMVYCQQNNYSNDIIQQILSQQQHYNTINTTNTNNNSINNDRILQNMSPFPIFLISKFKQYYTAIKYMNLTQIRKSPMLIKHVKYNMNALLQLIKDKQNKSTHLFMDYLYHKNNNNSNNNRSRGTTKNDIYGNNNKNNGIVDSISNIILNANINNNKDNIKDNNNDSMNMTNYTNNNTNQIQNKQQQPITSLNSTYPTSKLAYSSSAYSPYSYMATKILEYPIEQIQNQLCKLIPKILTIVQLYELLAANSQRKYESVPNINKFVTSLSAKQQVKLALLDLFSNQDISTSQTITKFNTLLPQIRLSADIYLSKWLKFIYRPITNVANNNNNANISNNNNNNININNTKNNTNNVIINNSNNNVINIINNIINGKDIIEQKQRQKRQQISSQIRLSDLQELGKQVQLQHMVKIKHIFIQTNNYHHYLRILLIQLQLRQLQYQSIQLQIISKDTAQAKLLLNTNTLLANNHNHNTYNNNNYNNYNNYNNNNYNNYNRLEQSSLIDNRILSSINNSIFNKDRQKSYKVWLDWLHSQIQQIRQQILQCMQAQAIDINISSPQQYLNRQLVFDQCIKILDINKQGKMIIKQLIKYMKANNNLLPQKIYRLEVLLNREDKILNTGMYQNIANSVLQTNKMEEMNSFQLLNALARKNKHDIFGNTDYIPVTQTGQIGQIGQIGQMGYIVDSNINNIVNNNMNNNVNNNVNSNVNMNVNNVVSNINMNNNMNSVNAINGNINNNIVNDTHINNIQNGNTNYNTDKKSGESGNKIIIADKPIDLL